MVRRKTLMSAGELKRRGTIITAAVHCQTVSATNTGILLGQGVAGESVLWPSRPGKSYTSLEPIDRRTGQIVPSDGRASAPKHHCSVAGAISTSGLTLPDL